MTDNTSGLLEEIDILLAVRAQADAEIARLTEALERAEAEIQRLSSKLDQICNDID